MSDMDKIPEQTEVPKYHVKICDVHTDNGKTEKTEIPCFLGDDDETYFKCRKSFGKWVETDEIIIKPMNIRNKYDDYGDELKGGGRIHKRKSKKRKSNGSRKSKTTKPSKTKKRSKRKKNSTSRKKSSRKRV